MPNREMEAVRVEHREALERSKASLSRAEAAAETYKREATVLRRHRPAHR